MNYLSVPKSASIAPVKNEIPEPQCSKEQEFLFQQNKKPRGEFMVFEAWQDVQANATEVPVDQKQPCRTSWGLTRKKQAKHCNFRAICWFSTLPFPLFQAPMSDFSEPCQWTAKGPTSRVFWATPQGSWVGNSTHVSAPALKCLLFLCSFSVFVENLFLSDWYQPTPRRHY